MGPSREVQGRGLRPASEGWRERARAHTLGTGGGSSLSTDISELNSHHLVHFHKTGVTTGEGTGRSTEEAEFGFSFFVCFHFFPFNFLTFTNS